MGAECSIAATTLGSEENVAVKVPINPSSGTVKKTIKNGSKPLIRKTAIKIPHIKNQRLAFFPMVDKTSALITALSIEETVSKRARPKTINVIETKSIMTRLPCL